MDNIRRYPTALFYVNFENLCKLRACELGTELADILEYANDFGEHDEHAHGHEQR